tara:strand:+ start:1265 stop:1390 length:126 start_codon:yes stop_codon:yes gene_type:complete
MKILLNAIVARLCFLFGFHKIEEQTRAILLKSLWFGFNGVL